MRAGIRTRLARLEARRLTDPTEEPAVWPMPPPEWFAELEAILREHGHWEAVLQSLGEREEDATNL